MNSRKQVWASRLVAAFVLSAALAHAIVERRPGESEVLEGIILVVGLSVLNARVTPAAWRLWRGTGASAFPDRSPIPPRVQDSLTLASPALVVSMWVLILTLVMSLVEPDDLPRWVDFAQIGFALLFPVFGLFALTAAKFEWPRFVLPAANRRDYQPIRQRLRER